MTVCLRLSLKRVAFHANQSVKCSRVCFCVRVSAVSVSALSVSAVSVSALSVSVVSVSALSVSAVSVSAMPFLPL